MKEGTRLTIENMISERLTGVNKRLDRAIDTAKTAEARVNTIREEMRKNRGAVENQLDAVEKRLYSLETLLVKSPVTWSRPRNADKYREAINKAVKKFGVFK